MTAISEQDFLAIAGNLYCRANLDERREAISPDYIMYSLSARSLLDQKTFPPWRTNYNASRYVGAVETPRSEAFRISYGELAQKPLLFDAIIFDPAQDYFGTNIIIVFHCQTCGVRLVKDGNHRLLQCALRGLDHELQIIEVRSHNWSASRSDMKNFCECISNDIGP